MRLRRIIWLLTLLAAFGCCKKGAESIRFTAEARGWVATEAASELPGGTAVGIIAAAPVDMPNVRAVSSGKTLTPDVAFYWGGGKDAVQFFAYTPYVASYRNVPFDFTVEADQRTDDAYKASDLMTAVVSVTPGKTVPFSLEHRLSKIGISVTGETAETGSVSKVKLRNVPITGTVNDAAGTVTATGAKSDILARPDDTGKQYSAIIIPGSLKLTVEFETTKGKYYTCTLPTAVQFEGGQPQLTTINLSTATAYTGDVAFKVTVTDWTDGGKLPFQ